MAPKGISNTQKIQAMAISWQDYGKYVKELLIRIIFHNVEESMYSNTVTCFAMVFTIKFRIKDLGNCQKSSSYSMTTLSTQGTFNEGKTGNNRLGNHEPPSLQLT
jgi:hypothetical protein